MRGEDIAKHGGLVLVEGKGNEGHTAQGIMLQLRTEGKRRLSQTLKEVLEKAGRDTNAGGEKQASLGGIQSCGGQNSLLEVALSGGR